MDQPSRRHHFVPKLLLEPWLIQSADGQRNLHGYWWHHKQQKLVYKRKGLNSFCFQIDLLTLREHHLGQDAIERLFFGEIDTKGADARQILLDGAPSKLTPDQRSDFARLLLSLEARHPNVMARLRNEGAAHLAGQIDSDTYLRSALAREGIDESPSAFIERRRPNFFEDRAISTVQKIVLIARVGARLVNAHWGVRRFDPQHGSLVLSDRPLIKLHGYDQPSATWLLPLTPHAVFIACNHKSNLAWLLRHSPQRLVKHLNWASAQQAERFVFSIDATHEKWLGKYLSRPAPATSHSRN